MSQQWILIVEEDPDTGEAFLQLTPDILANTGWKEGDTLTWIDNGDGSWLLTKG